MHHIREQLLGNNSHDVSFPESHSTNKSDYGGGGTANNTTIVAVGNGYGPLPPPPPPLPPHQQGRITDILTEYRLKKMEICVIISIIFLCLPKQVH